MPCIQFRTDKSNPACDHNIPAMGWFLGANKSQSCPGDGWQSYRTHPTAWDNTLPCPHIPYGFHVEWKYSMDSTWNMFGFLMECTYSICIPSGFHGVIPHGFHVESMFIPWNGSRWNGDLNRI
jgi:hypothetical protein